MSGIPSNEISAKPLGAGPMVVAAATAKQSPISQEVLAAQLCDLAADMRTMRDAIRILVGLQRDSIPVQEAMLAHIMNMAAESKELRKSIDGMVELNKEGIEKQDKLISNTQEMVNVVTDLSKRMMFMMEATDKNMSQLSLNSAILIASTTTPRNEGETVEAWRARIGVEAMGMYDWAEAGRKREMEKVEKPDDTPSA